MSKNKCCPYLPCHTHLPCCVHCEREPLPIRVVITRREQGSSYHHYTAEITGTGCAVDTRNLTTQSMDKMIEYVRRYANDHHFTIASMEIKGL